MNEKFTGLILRDLSLLLIRSNDKYTLRLCESLSNSEKVLVAATAVNINLFKAVLFYADVRVPELKMKPLSARAAFIFSQLKESALVKDVLPELLAEERDKILACLILDGILEISINGTFVSNFFAYSAIIKNDDYIIGTNEVSVLSINALQHASRFMDLSQKKLAVKLYYYNRLPVTSWVKKLWPNVESVLEHLGILSYNYLKEDFIRGFKMFIPKINSHWIYWHRNTSGKSDELKSGQIKLYVSPQPNQIKEALLEVVKLLSDSNASNLKIGCNAYDLMRPDKLIVYFNHFSDLNAFATRLHSKIKGMRVHGVPFSSAIDGQGLLSWATEPSEAGKDFNGRTGSSWRMWVCNQLSGSLYAAGITGIDDMTMCKFALTRLWLEGVDTRNWTFFGSTKVLN